MPSSNLPRRTFLPAAGAAAGPQSTFGGGPLRTAGGARHELKFGTDERLVKRGFDVSCLSLLRVSSSLQAGERASPPSPRPPSPSTRTPSGTTWDSPTSPESCGIEDLILLFDLAEVGVDRYLSLPGPAVDARIFGGQILAQCLPATARTVEAHLRAPVPSCCTRLLAATTLFAGSWLLCGPGLVAAQAAERATDGTTAAQPKATLQPGRGWTFSTAFSATRRSARRTPAGWRAACTS